MCLFLSLLPLPRPQPCPAPSLAAIRAGPRLPWSLWFFYVDHSASSIIHGGVNEWVCSTPSFSSTSGLPP